MNASGRVDELLDSFFPEPLALNQASGGFRILRFPVVVATDRGCGIYGLRVFRWKSFLCLSLSLSLSLSLLASAVFEMSGWDFAVQTFKFQNDMVSSHAPEGGSTCEDTRLKPRIM